MDRTALGRALSGDSSGRRLVRIVAAMLFACGWSSSGAEAQASEAPRALMPALSDGTALTLPPGRVRIALFAPTRVGVSEGVELATHPLSMWLFPHVDARFRVFSQSRLTLAGVVRFSLPSLFLEALAKEGALGLLPADSNIPFTVGLDAEFRATFTASQAQLFTLSWGVLTAAPFGDEDFPLLDFPFLFGRFAQTRTGAVVRLRLSSTTSIARRYFHRVGLTYTVVPLDDTSWVVEPTWLAGMAISESFALEAGVLGHVARLPVGLRLHVLPVIDAHLTF